MRARICSALSCDMFARVVWLRLRRARDSRLSLCHLPHALATHYFLRLTRARGVSSQREGNALFADFWYFWSRKSTIKEKWLYLKKTPHPSAYGCHLLPQSRRRQHTCSAYVSIPLQDKVQVQPTAKRKNQMLFSLFLLQKQAQKKKLSKRKRQKEISHSAECLPSLGDADTHAPRMCQFPPLSVDDTAF